MSLFILVSKGDAQSNHLFECYLFTQSGQGVFSLSPMKPGWKQIWNCWTVHGQHVSCTSGLRDGWLSHCLLLGHRSWYFSLCSLLARENFITKDGLCTCPKSFLVLLVLWSQHFTVDFLLFWFLLFVIYHADSLIELQVWQMVLGCPFSHNAKAL